MARFFAIRHIEANRGNRILGGAEMKMSPDCSKTNAKGRVPRTQKGRLRVDLLKQTARGLFVDLGYDATTMSAIAAEAGASIGSLYQYFPTKQHIVQEIEKDGLSAVLACLDGLGACDRPPSEIAVEAFDALVDYGNKDPAFRVISERHDLDPAARKQMRDMICARIADRLRRRSLLCRHHAQWSRPSWCYTLRMRPMHPDWPRIRRQIP